MRVWVDCQSLQTASRLRGIGRFLIELLRALADRPEIDRILVSLNADMGHEAIEARGLLEPVVGRDHIHLWHARVDGGEAATGLDGPRALAHLALVHHVNCLGPDIALSPSPFEGQADPAVPLLPHPALSMPVVAVFHDAIPHRFADTYLTDDDLRRYYYRRLESHRGFDAILGVSEFSAREARDLVPGVPATAIGEGLSASVRERIQALGPGDDRPPPVPGRYALYVGGLDARKNVGTLIDAWPRLPAATARDVKLVLAGDHPAALEQQLIRRWEGHGLRRDALVLLNTVDDETLVRLYRGAAALVQPSLMEGFGLTALEALACGTAVVASNGGAIPEVVGEERLLFDPRSPADLADRLAEVLAGRLDPSIVERAARRALERHSFAGSAQRAAAVFANLASADRPVQDRPALRARIAPHIATAVPRRTDRALAPTLMACAEPPEPGPPRLIVDATSTLRNDHKTGIQRVVTKICPGLASPARRRDWEIGYVYCDDTDGWYLSPAWGDEARLKAEDRRWLCRPNDRLLMLDSSWEFQNIHRRRLREARARGIDVISCLFDLVPLKMPAMCAGGMPEIFTAWLKSALTYSTGFVCISRAVADEFHRLLDAMGYPHAMKIGYWPLGADFADGEGVPGPEAGGADTDGPATFLMVGTVEPRKGHWVALRAFEALWAAGLEVRLDIVGKPGWSTGTLAERLDGHPEAGRRLAWHRQVSDAELACHYRRATALLACSHAEGFGLPIVEAGHFGKPAIVSDLPVFREVGHGAVGLRLFEPGSAAALAQTIRDFLAEGGSGRGAPPSSGTVWPDWAASADRLAEIVLTDDWYRVYRPARPQLYPGLTDLGRTRLAAIVPPGDRRYRLRTPDPLSSTSEDGPIRLSVWVENHSPVAWSGAAGPNGAFAVVLEGRIAPRRGPDPGETALSVPLPFVVPPGDQACLPLDLPISPDTVADHQITLRLVQDGIAWTEDEVTLNLGDLLP